jgi:16S rRNA (uracil1498-N3)-methyltransferase
LIRLHVAADLTAGGGIALGRDQAHYLTHVMRLGPGDELLLFNGRDGEWRARIGLVGKKGAALEVVAKTKAQQAPPDLDLVVALVKRARLETIVEKAAELGARRVRLAITQRTNADHARVDRLQAIAVEAAEQTGRLDVPEVLPPQKLEALLSAWEPGRRLMYCDEGGEVPPALEALKGAPGAPWGVLIGPEGGFTLEERTRLRELSFVVPVGLGPRILRADTAAISALSLWQAAVGDWAERA